MRLAFYPDCEFDITDARFLQQIREWGFRGIAPYCGHIGDVAQFTEARCAEIRAVLDRAGLDMTQLGQYDLNFISPDPAVRKANIERLKRSLENSALLGCPVVVTGSGSLHTDQWLEHEGNHGWRSFDLLVQSLRECVQTAADTGVYLGIECHTFTAFDSVERTRDVIEAVDSPMLKLNMDPVNWISSYAQYRHNGPFIHHMFDVLGRYVQDGHAKDLRLEDGLVLHINETYPGDGNLDYVTYLYRLNQVNPNVYLVIENTPVDKVVTARDYILRQAAEAGVEIEL